MLLIFPSSSWRDGVVVFGVGVDPWPVWRADGDCVRFVEEHQW